MTTTYDATGLAGLIECVGKIGTLTVRELKVDVQVVDVRRSYGKVQYLVQPLAGWGQQWVEYPTVKALRDV